MNANNMNINNMNTDNVNANNPNFNNPNEAPADNNIDLDATVSMFNPKPEPKITVVEEEPPKFDVNTLNCLRNLKLDKAELAVFIVLIVVGVLLAIYIVGIVFIVWAFVYKNNRLVEKWWSIVKSTPIEAAIRDDVEVANLAYFTMPKKEIGEKIKKLNPNITTFVYPGTQR